MATDAGVEVGADGLARCWWCGDDAIYTGYHDTEWGRPVADDRRLFEVLSLEGFQAGLSWLTILRKRDAFRRAFADFEIDAVAEFDRRSVARLMADEGIVRNRAKIEATINNARRCAEMVEELGGLGAYVWGFEPDPRSRPASLDRAALLAMDGDAASAALSADLRRRGWRFVGPTTVYAFMQATGLVNDHLRGCDARARVEAARDAFPRPRSARTP
jgi:DNA-3-methyladenine glycosylase I